jgi:hypothetical protein
VKINITTILQVLQLISAVAPGVAVVVGDLVSALKSIGAVTITDAQAEADLTQLVTETMAAKAQADAAASGQDPQ